MRGDVLNYDETTGSGAIGGGDGKRYVFERADIRGEGVPALGRTVEFHRAGDRARDVVLIEPIAERARPSPFGRNPATPEAIDARKREEAAPERPREPPFPTPIAIPVPRDARLRPLPGEADASAEDRSVFGYFLHGMTGGYADFRRRARRKEYWSFALLWTVVLFLLGAAGIGLDGALGNLDPASYATPWIMIAIVSLATLAGIVPILAVTVRRLHDIGLPGWFVLLGFIPYVGGLIVFVMTLIPSQKRDNKWGPVPQGVSA